jgi:hypothetical protein
MIVFIHGEKGMSKTANGYTAMKGFEMLGAEIILFDDVQNMLEFPITV